MNELTDVIEQTGGQVLRSTLVAAGILVLRLAVKKYIPAKWSYALCLVAAAWLLVPATPPSVASLWRFLPSGMESGILPTEPISKNPGKSLFPEVELREVGDPVEVETGPKFTSKAEIPVQILAANLSDRDVALLWIGGIWGLGVVVFSLLLVYRETVVRIGIRRGTQLQDCTLEEVRKRLGINRKVRLIETDSITSPALAGFFRPVILVAPRFRNTLSEKENRHVYMHELIHLKRHDVVSRLFLKIALILQWPNPVAWWANRSSLEDVELATDAAVLAELQGPEERSDYGNTLLTVARKMAHSRSPFAANLLGMADAARSNLEKRISGIVSFGRVKKRSHTAMTFSVVVVALLSLSIGFSPSVAQENKTEEQLHEVTDIRLPEVEFSKTKLGDALKVLEDEARKRDPAGKGITISLSDEIREQLKGTEITLKLQNVPVKSALWFTAGLAGLSYKVDGNIFTLLPKANENDIYTNVYAVPPTFVTRSTQAEGDPFAPGGDDTPLKKRHSAKKILSEAGITFPEGTSAIYNPGTSHLIVRNTADQMQLVDAYIDSIRQSFEKLIHIEVRQFISENPFQGFAPGRPYDPQTGVSRTFNNEEAMKDFLSGEEVKKQVAEAKQKAEKMQRQRPREIFCTRGIYDAGIPKRSQKYRKAG
ncbi:MAG: M56 family metallopeptidase [Verrucomicrobiales bacterium]|nr:M56 family metallopeptidase [Verrucomicrobiales bacterium]